MMADHGQRCKIMVDRTDFSIQGPIHFNPKWYSHKFKGPGLHYEIDVCIKTGWIVWVNGYFLVGEWPDYKIEWSGTSHCFYDHQCYVGDGGLYNGQQWPEMPTRHSNPELIM